LITIFTERQAERAPVGTISPQAIWASALWGLARS
jgi:hypothetical protein